MYGETAPANFADGGNNAFNRQPDRERAPDRFGRQQNTLVLFDK